MKCKICSLYICVEDMNRAINFYEDFFEQPVTERDKLYSVFDINGFRFGLFAYTIVNDVTARDLQSKDGQWTRSKSYDTFCPCGPVVVTGIDSSNLNIKTMVNNDIKQESNTKNMIFSPLELVKYISNIMTLNPGDIIASGTPPGVGHLDVGDTVVVEIDEMGSLVNIVK